MSQGEALLAEEVRMLCDSSASFQRFWSTRFNMPKGYADHELWKRTVAPFVGLSARVLGLADLPWRPGNRLWEGVSRADVQAYEAWWVTATTCHQAVSQDGPFYVVGADLMTTLGRAKNPPTQWSLEDIDPPYAGTTFFLPLGHPAAGGIAVITVAVISADMLQEKFQVKRSNRRATLLVQAFAPDFNEAYHGNVQCDAHGVFDLDQLLLPIADKHVDHIGTVSKPPDFTEALRLLKLTGMACSLLALLRQEQDYVEQEVFLKNAKLRPPFTDIPKTRIMDPKKLGFNVGVLKKYVRSEGYLRGDGSGPTRTMETHWRAPHWHTIRFGHNRSNSKVKWFPPIQVNPPEKDDPISPR
jgi:hypothetical protein